MQEKRSSKRVSFREPVSLQVLNDRQEAGCLGHDISAGGLRCIVNDFIPLGQELDLTLHIKEQMVSLHGRVVWVIKSPHSESYQIGVRFLNMERTSPERQIFGRLAL